MARLLSQTATISEQASQSELDASGFPSGTKMVFNQTASPTGWTKVTGSGNDHALRLTTGTVGTGGDVAFETAFADKTVTPTSSTPTSSTPSATSGAVAGHTLARSEVPEHTHAFAGWNSGSHGSNANVLLGNESGGYTLSNAGGVLSGTGGTNSQPVSSGSHGHSFTQPTISTPIISTPTISSVPIDLNVSFVDVIIATKD